MKIAYVVSDLRRVGPTKQTLNIIKYSPYRKDCVVITLFAEPEDTMLEEFRTEGIKVACLNLSRTWFLWNGMPRLRSILLAERAELVHSYGIKADPLAQRACRDVGVPHVITLRNYPKEDILTRMGPVKGRIALASILQTLKRAKYIVACSKTICVKMLKDYPKMQITPIQNGVDVTKYRKTTESEKRRLREKLGLPPNQKILISTSTFIRRKRIAESIEGVLKTTGDLAFVLLGDGEYLVQMQDTYRMNKVIFRGSVPNVAEHLAAADFFVSSSESEGLPNGVIEAIAAGLPVVLSDIPQHAEVLDEVPFSGLLYKLGDVKDLAGKLREIQKFDNAKSDITKSNLTMKKMSENYAKYYRFLMARSVDKTSAVRREV